MAKHNYVMLYGQVAGQPRIHTDKEGNPNRVICPITVLRGIRDAGDNIRQLKYDRPIIMSGNPAMIEEMAKWKENDMVEVKGAVTTKDINKSTKCKECGHVNISKGNVVFINPIYADVRETGITKEEGQKLLKKRCEISNVVVLIGKLCRDPEYIYTPRGTLVTQYQLAVNRKFHIKEDAPNIRTDYPWIKSFGDIARMDAKVLSTGSMVLIDGAIQTRSIERRTACESCGAEYSWNDSAFEVIPYAVEYLQDYKLPEEVAAEEEKLNKEAIKSVFDD